MAPRLKITATGHGSVSRKAERAVLHITVSVTCSTQVEASQRVQSTTERLAQKFRSHAAKTETGLAHPTAGITGFMASAMMSSSLLPRDENNKLQGEASRQYTAMTTFQVIFKDLGLLADTSAELAGMPYVSIKQTEWRLTDTTKAEMEPEVRGKAIRSALRIAEDHASAVGRKVAAVEIKDNGILFPNSGSAMQQALPRSSFVPATTAAVFEQGSSVQPGIITARAHVNVEFLSVDND